ncbi:hypothetical protein [Rubidibacter lacunae]|uniref:hypothetical protein n=1 Tax=Rubidibacter lacunae TaxID=582514 RepID=UPI0012ECAC57|nr:hypothetical protein [Rubidibacter lacunae]
MEVTAKVLRSRVKKPILSWRKRHDGSTSIAVITMAGVRNSSFSLYLRHAVSFFSQAEKSPYLHDLRDITLLFMACLERSVKAAL